MEDRRRAPGNVSHGSTTGRFSCVALRFSTRDSTHGFSVLSRRAVASRSVVCGRISLALDGPDRFVLVFRGVWSRTLATLLTPKVLATACCTNEVAAMVCWCCVAAEGAARGRRCTSGTDEMLGCFTHVSFHPFPHPIPPSSHGWMDGWIVPWVGITADWTTVGARVSPPTHALALALTSTRSDGSSEDEIGWIPPPTHASDRTEIVPHPTNRVSEIARVHAIHTIVRPIDERNGRKIRIHGKTSTTYPKRTQEGDLSYRPRRGSWFGC